MKKILGFMFGTLSFAFACASDYQCDLGYKCVKPYGQAIGQCMEKVDQFGFSKKHDISRESNYGANKKAECSFDMDCPVGFRCDSMYKACIKR